MNALDLHIEHAVGIYLDPREFLDLVGQALLVGLLDLAECLAEIRVLGIGRKFGQLFEILLETATNRGSNESGQTGVALIKPASWRDAVGDIDEFFRVDAIEIGKQRSFQQFTMQRSDAIDRKSTRLNSSH